MSSERVPAQVAAVQDLALIGNHGLHLFMALYHLSKQTALLLIAFRFSVVLEGERLLLP